MKIYYLDISTANRPEDLPLRQRYLYGPDIVFLGDRDGEHAINIGPLLTSSSEDRTVPIIQANLGENISRVMKERNDGILMIGNHYLAAAMIGAGMKFAFDPCDSQALYFRRRISPQLARTPLKIINSMRLFLHFRELERRILSYTSCFVTTGHADELYLRELYPAANVIRVGNGTNLIDEPTVAPKHDGRTIGFHGYMPWEPNHTAADVLTGKIADALVKLPGPPIRILVAGQGTPDRIQRRNGQNGVEICGFVENLGSWLGALTLYVMPMVLGAGVKNKLIEALAAGIPVLTNQRGAESLPAECQTAVGLVKNDQDWAPRIRDLLSRPDELERMRIDERKAALKHFDWRIHRQELHAVLELLRREKKL